MKIFFELGMTALLTVAVSTVFYLLEKKTVFNKLPYIVRQIIIGLFFAGVAVIGTEYGVDVGGAAANARDSAPLCAGLIFGGPAGIIAGLIGGVERWCAAYWGVGVYSKWACSVSTFFAGVYAATLRKHMFDGKKPSWTIGFAIAVVMEALHMTILFLTHPNDSETAFIIVKTVTEPMMLVNAVAVSLSIIVAALIDKEKLKNSKPLKSVAGIIQGRMLACVIIAFVVTSVFVYGIQNGVSINRAKTELELEIQDIENEIEAGANEHILDVARKIAKEYSKDGTADLNNLARAYSVEEINVSNKTGILIKSTNPDLVGYDIRTGEQSRQFTYLLNGKEEYAQKFGATSYGSGAYMKYAGVALPDGFIQVGYDAEHFQDDIYDTMQGITRYRHIGNDGYIVLTDRNNKIISAPDGVLGQDFGTSDYFDDALLNIKEDEISETQSLGVKTMVMRKNIEGYTAYGFLPKDEVFFERDAVLYINSYMEILVFAVLFALIYLLIKKHIVTGVRKVNSALSKITSGDLDVTVDVKISDEFANLSNGINSTVKTLKRYIKEAEERIDKELEFAKEIQTSALPRIFPPFPNEKRFDIFASMRTAKEVGGDFYDFFFVGENKLAFLVADVSGKGIPAAMFMMTAKSIIKSYAETGIDANEVLKRANNELCRNNDAGMFVTAWIGILDLLSGSVTFSNAGHNSPALIKKDGSVAFLKSKPGLVLAGMEEIPYMLFECKLEKGDKLYLYTDGITEATNAKDELFGDERLVSSLENAAPKDVKAVCEAVLEDVDKFVGDAEQFDDMTMLCVKYNEG